jgi:CHASE2 domain-containing sensor protein
MLNLKLSRANFFSAFLLSIVLYSLSSISLFGLKDVIDRQSQDLFNILVGEYIYPIEGRSEYSVVLITESTLSQKNLQNSWPYSPDSYATLLGSILALEPKSLFIDIQWKSMEAGIGECNKINNDYKGLVDILSYYADDEIPVFLATVNSGETDGCQLPKEILALTKPVSVELSISKFDGVSRSYQFEGNGLLSAALAICKHHFETNCGTEIRKSMDIIWGMKANPLNDWMEGAVDNQTVTDKSIGTSIFTKGKQAIVNSRPYSNYLLAEDVVNRLSDDQDVPNQDAQAYDDLKARITGKNILLGANIIASGDYVFSPNGQVRPGVFYHAMALDNLISFGNNFKDKESTISREVLKFFTILILSFMSVVYSKVISARDVTEVLITYSSSRPKRLLGQLIIFLPLVLFVLLSVVIIFISSCLSYFNLNQAPSTWLSYFGLVFVGVYASKMEMVGNLNNIFLYIYHGDIRS